MQSSIRFKKYLIVGSVIVLLGFISLKTVPRFAPLLPREILFCNAHMVDISIAPCGTKIAYLASVHEDDPASPLTIWIQDLNSSEKKPLLRSLTRSIKQYQWASNGLILYLQDNDGDENWRLYGIDTVTEQSTCYTPFDNCKTCILETAGQDSSTIAITLNKRTSDLHDVYILNLQTGTLTLSCINPGAISQWVLDKQLRVRAAMRETLDGGKELLIKTGSGESGWKVVRTYSPEENHDNCSLIAYSSYQNCVYLLESKESNTIRLISFNLATEESTIIVQDPVYDITGAYFDLKTEEVHVGVCEREKPEWHILRSGIYERIYRAVSKKYPGTIEVLNCDRQGTRFIVSVEQDTCPMCYYLYNDTTYTVIELCKSWGDIPESALCPTKPISLESRDGLTLHGYLTLPQGKTRHVPLILFVHGGPWSRARWEYSAVIQWLANRGYGVLNINYRGSTGYGKELTNAGNKEWGGAMQDDLIDAATWSIHKGIADPKKIAIFGASYGGYAALVGATDTPNFFCCAIDVVGISNLVSFLHSIPPYWNIYRTKLYQKIGNPHTEKAFLESRSPLFKVDAIRIPLFIAQGACDPRVPKEESEQIVCALQRKGIPYTYLLFEDEGHVIVNAHNRLRLYAELEKFLAQTLGGVCEL
ncbi:S9 family peptidase [Candidatus Dependentiae bacterium]|nr:S9 family peptidase [Candidatus Dependentiae bacterium]